MGRRFQEHVAIEIVDGIAVMAVYLSFAHCTAVRSVLCNDSLQATSDSFISSSISYLY